MIRDCGFWITERDQRPTLSQVWFWDEQSLVFALVLQWAIRFGVVALTGKGAPVPYKKKGANQTTITDKECDK